MIAPNHSPGEPATVPTVAAIAAEMRDFTDMSRIGITNWLRNLSRVQDLLSKAHGVDGMRTIVAEIELSLKHQLQEVAAHCQRLMQPVEHDTTHEQNP